MPGAVFPFTEGQTQFSKLVLHLLLLHVFNTLLLLFASGSLLWCSTPVGGTSHCHLESLDLEGKISHSYHLLLFPQSGKFIATLLQLVTSTGIMSILTQPTPPK